MPRNNYIVTFSRDGGESTTTDFTRWTACAAFIRALLMDGYIVTVKHDFVET